MPLFTIDEQAKPARVLIMVSKLDHCLVDLLYRQRRGCGQARAADDRR